MSGWQAVFCRSCCEAPSNAFGMSSWTIGWSIAWIDNTGEEYLVPLHFGRKIDAELAVKAVCEIGPWSDDRSDVVQKIFEYGTEKFRELLCRDLAW
jgi:hypothetical protein